MPQNSSQGTKSQNFLGGLTAPPNPQLHMESFIQRGGPGPLFQKMKKTAFFICFIYYPAIMPQNSSRGTKSQNFPPNPQLHMARFARRCLRQLPGELAFNFTFSDPPYMNCWIRQWVGIYT